MFVSMMSIRPVNMGMGNRLVHMIMVMRLRKLFIRMGVTMMIVYAMGVLMTMGNGFVTVGMFMPFVIETENTGEHH